MFWNLIWEWGQEVYLTDRGRGNRGHNLFGSLGVSGCGGGREKEELLKKTRSIKRTWLYYERRKWRWKGRGQTNIEEEGRQVSLLTSGVMWKQTWEQTWKQTWNKTDVENRFQMHILCLLCLFSIENIKNGVLWFLRGIICFYVFLFMFFMQISVWSLGFCVSFIAQ